MAIGYILALLIAGAVAAVLFGRLAESKGYLASKARRYPLLLMIAAISVAVILLIGVILIGVLMPHWQGMMHSVYLVGNWFVIAVYLVVLIKAYRNMKSAPDAKSVKSEV